MVGIIAPMGVESDIILSRMKLSNKKIVGTFQFFEGIFNQRPIVLVNSGVGKVNAAACAQCLIDNYRITHILNVGIAGALKDNLNPGDIVVSTECVEYDMDCTPLGYMQGIIPDMDTSIFKSDKELLDKIKDFIAIFNQSHKTQAVCGRVVSGDKFVASNSLRDELSYNFQGSCVEMEGAAIAHVCYLNSTPYTIIRSISDSAGDSSSEEYVTNKEQSASDLQEFVYEVMSVLK